MSNYIAKGARIRAQWLATRPVSLAGVQLKFEATRRDVVGVVRYVRGDHPTAPSVVKLYIDAEGERGDATPFGCTCGPHTEVDPAHVVDVLA